MFTRLFFQTLFFGLVAFLLNGLPAFCQSFEASGTWSSTWGPVTLSYDGVNRDGTQVVVGSWKEASGNRGVITNGGFNRRNGNLWFDYYQPWDHVKGSANFNLKNDGTVFEGNYHQTNGAGHWTLTRPLQHSIAQAPAAVAQNNYDDDRQRGGRGKRGSRGKNRGDRDGDGIPNQFDNHDASTRYSGANVAAASTDINGSWSSNFGAVSLQTDSVRQDGVWRVTGSWVQAPGRVGQIQKGRYNPQDGSVWIKYFMPWKNLSGEANLKLKSRGRVLEGTWQQSDGSGSWRMER